MLGQADGFTQILNCHIEQNHTKDPGYLDHYACAKSFTTEEGGLVGLEAAQIWTGLVVRVSLSRPFASPPLIEFVPSSS